MVTGLRTRTLLLITSLVLFAGVAYGFYALTRERDLLHEELRTNMEASLGAFAIPCAMAIASDRVDLLDNLVAAVQARADRLGLIEITVVDHDGRVLADSRLERFGELLTDGFTREALRVTSPLWRVEGGRALVSQPVFSGLRWGTLRAAVTLEPLERRLAARRLEFGVVFSGAAVGLALVLMLLLGALVVDPVRRLAAVARRFGEGERRARVARYRRDEIGDLGRAFDEMAGQIARHTEELEQTVAERTAQLAESNQQLIQANQQLAQANQKLEQLAITDGLTRVFNHRHFQEVLALEVKRGERASHQMALIMIDVDHFKTYNDTQGHPAGDQALRELAELLRRNLRQIDVVARYGGEEFVVLLLDSDREAGLATAEKLRALVAAHPFAQREQQPGGTFTISLGVAFYPDDGRSPGDLIFAADQALYRSKHAGRNRVSATEVPA